MELGKLLILSGEAVDVVRRRLLALATVAEAHSELMTILALPAPYGRVIRTLGLGVLSAGFALAL